MASSTPLSDFINSQMSDGKSLEEALMDLPIQKWPCGECLFGRIPKIPADAEFRVVCGWWDDRSRWPMIAPVFGGLHGAGDAARSCTFKQAYGPHSDDPPLVCATFQPKFDSKEAADGQ